MSRERKSRGKRKDNGEEIIGFYVDNSSPTQSRHFIITQMGFESEVDPETVGEFTGLCDRNGKEIYEGDKIKSYNPIKLERGEEADYTGIVSWSTVSFAWVLVNDTGKFIKMLCRAEAPEVVGNIHDNPEPKEKTE